MAKKEKTITGKNEIAGKRLGMAFIILGFDQEGLIEDSRWLQLLGSPIKEKGKRVKFPPGSHITVTHQFDKRRLQRWIKDGVPRGNEKDRRVAQFFNLDLETFTDPDVDDASFEKIIRRRENNPEADISDLLPKVSLGFQKDKELADGGSAEHQYRVGVRYKTGEGITKDDENAFQWIKKAALNQHIEAQEHLALLHYYGEGVEKNEDFAAVLCRTYTERNYGVNSQFYLGLMYMKHGKGLDQGVKYIEKAAENQNFGFAQYYLGLIYFWGAGTQKNLKKSNELLRKSAELGVSNGIHLLIRMHEKGLGVQQDEKIADRLWKVAKRFGCKVIKTWNLPATEIDILLKDEADKILHLACQYGNLINHSGSIGLPTPLNLFDYHDEGGRLEKGSWIKEYMF